MAPLAMAVMLAMAASLLLPPATQVSAATVPRPKPNTGPKPYGRQPIPHVRPTPNVRPPNPNFRPPNPFIPPINPYVHPINPYVHPTPYVPPKKPTNFKSIIQKIIRKAAKHYLKDKAKEGIRNISSSSSSSSSSSQQQQQGNQLAGDAADTGAGALIAGVFIGSGTAQQILYGVIDITSELLWVQCGYCPSCRRLTPPQTRTIRLEASPSFYSVGCRTPYCKQVITGVQPNCDAAGRSPCRYEEVFYGGDQYTSGFLATETFTFGVGAMPFTGVVFGCSDDITVRGLDGGGSGFLGFSRGHLSLVWQLQLYGFSYYISLGGSTDAESFFALIWARPVQQPTGRHYKYTPLLEATAKQNPHLYYVNLTGVLVDNELLTAIPPGTFDVRAEDGSGGVYLSTTLPVTYLQKAAYRVLRQELVSRIQSQGVAPVSIDLVEPLCYMTRSLDNIKVPHLALVFHGADATLNLYRENYFLPLDGGQTCLTILPSTGGSVLGSLLQAGRTFTYSDIQGGGGWLSFD